MVTITILLQRFFTRGLTIAKPFDVAERLTADTAKSEEQADQSLLLPCQLSRAATRSTGRLHTHHARSHGLVHNYSHTATLPEERKRLWFQPSQAQQALRIAMSDPLAVGTAHRDLVQEGAGLAHRSERVVG